ncbi:hypothetical protein AZG88_42275 [Rhodococcus sp. LB1]|nr:hypothetical protein AZG88_42275 [Rhodococcus sp. LB1]
MVDGVHDKHLLDRFKLNHPTTGYPPQPDTVHPIAALTDPVDLDAFWSVTHRCAHINRPAAESVTGTSTPTPQSSDEGGS